MTRRRRKYEHCFYPAWRMQDQYRAFEEGWGIYTEGRWGPATLYPRFDGHRPPRPRPMAAPLPDRAAVELLVYVAAAAGSRLHQRAVACVTGKPYPTEKPERKEP